VGRISPLVSKACCRFMLLAFRPESLWLEISGIKIGLFPLTFRKAKSLSMCGITSSCRRSDAIKTADYNLHFHCPIVGERNGSPTLRALSFKRWIVTFRLVRREEVRMVRDHTEDISHIYICIHYENLAGESLALWIVFGRSSVCSPLKVLSPRRGGRA
jgi:hypothetical protein